MLEFIRKRATGWVAWGFVILISIPFALWGINQYFSPVSNLSVAEVNGMEIELREFQRAVQEQRSRLQQLLGPQLAASIDDQRVREQALEQMISEQLILQAAADARMRIGDAQLAEAIQSQDIFRSDGRFSQSAYENWLRQQGQSAGGFEELMRLSLVSGQLINGLVSSAFVTDAELARIRALQAQERRFRTLTIPVSRFDDVSISDDQIARHYEENKSRYARPEQVTVEYIQISRSDVASEIPIGDEELRRLYETRKSNYVTPEQRKVSHILLSLPEDADPAAAEEARETLRGIRDQILSGASFETMAKTHSDDPGTAQNGGDLGFIGKGVMEPAFESAAFSLEEGQLSEPVRTSFGVHLIKVTDIREARTRPFESVKSQLKTEYQNEEADLVFSEQLERLANQAFEHPESLESAAEALGAEIQVSQPFSREGMQTGIASNPEVVQAAFSEDVLERENNSEVLELDNGTAVVLRVKDHQPRQTRPLEAVKSRITEELEQKAAREKAIETGQALLERLKSGESPQAVAASANVEWSESKTVSRSNEELDPELRTLVFRMPRPKSDEATYEGRSHPQGDFEIVALQNVEDGASQQAPPEGELRQSIASSYGSTVLDEFSRALRNDAEVVINQENLQGGLR